MTCCIISWLNKCHGMRTSESMGKSSLPILTTNKAIYITLPWQAILTCSRHQFSRLSTHAQPCLNRSYTPRSAVCEFEIQQQQFWQDIIELGHHAGQPIIFLSALGRNFPSFFLVPQVLSRGLESCQVSTFTHSRAILCPLYYIASKLLVCKRDNMEDCRKITSQIRSNLPPGTATSLDIRQGSTEEHFDDEGSAKGRNVCWDLQGPKQSWPVWRNVSISGANTYQSAHWIQYRRPNPHKELKKFLSPAFTVRYVDGLEFLFSKCVSDLINRYENLLLSSVNSGKGLIAVTDLMDDLHSLALDM